MIIKSYDISWNSVEEVLSKEHISLHVANLISTLSKEPGNVLDAFSKAQLYSKWQLIQSLTESAYLFTSNIVICGGWIGMLAHMIHNRSPKLQITSIDIDPHAIEISQKINQFNPNFKALQTNMVGFDYSPYDVIINTSFEHIENSKEWLSSLPSNKTVYIQSNNAFGYKDHVNCSKTIQDLRLKLEDYMTVSEMSEIQFPKLYTRFMIRGHT